MKKQRNTAGIAAVVLTALILGLTGCGLVMNSTAGGEDAPGILHPKDAADFQNMIASGTVLVDFYADWCGPCRKMGPVLNKLSAAAGDSLKIVKVNVDHHRDLARQFKVQSIPYVVLFEEGQIKAAQAGYQDKNRLTNWIDKNSSDREP